MVYTGLVGLSRVVNTAHYLSDALFGYYVGFGVATLARWILINKVQPYMPEVKLAENKIDTDNAVSKEEVVEEN
jgi:membrane-associated phospholipid phosphatase